MDRPSPTVEVQAAQEATKELVGDPMTEERRRDAPEIDRQATEGHEVSGLKMRPLCIGIAGGTGSGKSTIAANIAAALPPTQVATIDHDSYYRDRSDLSFEERTALNFDHPDALETELLVAHLRALREGRAVEVPIYDFKTHSRLLDTRRVAPTPVLIVEGILVFVEPA